MYCATWQGSLDWFEVDLSAVAVCCSVLQCVAVVWGRSKCSPSFLIQSHLCIVYCVVVCCSVLRCVAAWFEVDPMCSRSFLIQSHLCIVYCTYRVAMISRPLKIIRLFWRTSSLLQGSCATETNNLCIAYFYKKRVVDTSRCVCVCVRFISAKNRVVDTKRWECVCACVCVSRMAAAREGYRNTKRFITTGPTR